MPRIVDIRPYGNGRAEYVRRYPVLDTEKISADLTALSAMAEYLAQGPNSAEKLGDLVEQLVFTWPWYYPKNLAKLRGHAIFQGMPAWAKERAEKIFDEIESGELVSTWQPE